MALIPKKVGKLSLMDAFSIAVAKTVSERLLGGIIGNGTFISGGIKIAGAIGIQKFVGGKISDILATAMIVDGTEDIVGNLMGGFGAGAGAGGGGEIL